MAARRPRANREPYYFRVINGFAVKALQIFRLSVGVGKRLEVDDEFVRMEAFPDICNAIANLLANRISFYCGRRAEGAVVAVGTSTGRHSSVPIRAGEAGIDNDFVNTLSKSVLQPPVITAEPF